MTETASPLVIDALGHRCPVPVLKLRKAMAEHPEIHAFHLRADDPMARIDVPHFCTQNSLILHAVAETERGLRFEIHR